MLYNDGGPLPENPIVRSRVSHDSAVYSMKTHITLALALLCASALSAQTFEISAFGGYNRVSQSGLGSLNFETLKKEDSNFKPGPLFGGRFTWNTKGYYGHELTILQSNTKFRSNVEQEDGSFQEQQGKARTYLASYNFLIYMMPNREKWRPYITGGITGAQFAAPKIPAWIGGGARSYGANYGGGIKLFPHQNFFVRLDFRHYITGKPYDLSFPEPTAAGQGIDTGGLLHSLEGSFGIGITF